MHRCEDLISQSFLLEFGPSCALSSRIVEEGDLLAGDAAALEDTCDADDDKTCVDEIVGVVDGIIEHGCETTGANSPFLYGLYYNKGDFDAVTDFACGTDCYSALRTCRDDEDACGSLSCECMRDFLLVVEGLSDDSQEDFLKIDGSMREVFNRCVCSEANGIGAALMAGGSCALHASIVSEGYLFAGSPDDLESTCADPTSCVANVTEVVAQIIDGGCAIDPNVDGLASFLYGVENSTDFAGITSFVCNGDDGCYEEVKAAVEECKSDDTVDCGELARLDCLRSFVDMVGRLSDDAKEDFLGIDMAVIGRLDTASVADTATTTTVATEPAITVPSTVDSATTTPGTVASSTVVATEPVSTTKVTESAELPTNAPTISKEGGAPAPSSSSMRSNGMAVIIGTVALTLISV